MRHRLLVTLALVVAACARPGSEFVGRWAPAAGAGAALPATLVGADAIEVRRDGERFSVTMHETTVPAHLSREGLLKVDGLIPLELAYSEERDSIYLMGVEMKRVERRAE